MTIRSVLTLLLLSTVLAPVSSRAATYSVGSSWTCTHRTIQAAVEAAKLQPGADVIRLTNTLSYLQQSVEIVDAGEVRLEGGFNSCVLGTVGATRTRIDGAGGRRASVVRIRNATVWLKNLELINGDTDDSGGGLRIEGGPSTWATLQNVRVAQNRALDGGGVSVSDGALLVMESDSVVESNVALSNGGGLGCRGSTVRMYGLRSRIVGNQASQGGGVHASGCHVVVRGNSVSGDGGTIASNVASESGGGVHLSQGSSLILQTTDPDAPVGLTGNRAAKVGGAVFLVDSVAEFDEAVIHGNSAAMGGGAGWVEARDRYSWFNFIGGRHWVNPDDALKCSNPRHCSRISNNVARDPTGKDQPGAAFVLAGSGGLQVLFLDASLFGNQGTSLVQGTDDLSDIHVRFDISEVRDNSVSGNLIDLRGVVSEHGNDELMIERMTLAHNKIGGAAVLHSQHAVILRKSILWQPSHRVLSLGQGLPGVEAFHTIASDLTGFAASPTAAIANPRFVDPTNGDLRLSAGSPAIDYTTNTIDLDRDGRAVIDLPNYPNRYGLRDLGAFEFTPVICCAWGG